MRYWKSLRRDGAIAFVAALGLAACTHGPRDASQLAIEQARLIHRGTATELLVSVAFQPSTRQVAALEHGVPLALRMRVSGSAARDVIELRLSLRYFPLSRRYQLRIEPAGIDRSYALRGYLLDALQRLRVPLPHDPCAGSTRCKLAVGLDYTELPGALRLPALFDTAWRVPVDAYSIRAESP